MPSVLIKTYGCQMNERDSEQVASMFLAGGYELTTDEAAADVILINTCSVREKAELKALGKMGLLCARPTAKPWVVYGFMGCMCQSRAASLFRDVPRLDIVTGTQQYHNVYKLCNRLLRSRLGQPAFEPIRRGAHICATQQEEGFQNAIRDHLPPAGNCTAFVSIMQGCEMRCSYCIVPSTRGSECSRPAADILQEVRELVDRGVKEVTLLGQIVNRYGKDEPVINGRGAFVRLLEQLNDMDGLERIRFTSPHPIGFRQDLVNAYTYLPKLCSHIHFPMQSGSDRILQLMRRPYKNEKYLRLCEAMREARPDLAITTDIIVGFPGETHEDYLETKAAVERIQFDNAFVFQYSPRRDTVAAAMDNQICLRVKEERNHDLLETVNRIAVARNQALVGTQQTILVEGPSKNNPERLQGRTSQNKPVIIPGGTAEVGTLVPVRIAECTGFTLYGEVE
ncbi:MAG: tRNA (N6-isopentenyl adenosine(37)-C2)-methylthiotransferase MiaB [Akkermansia sp.]|nr:tRNA (N6-isopentenyl adenosine(37)-C2)-methylthiotransferase MiaB [Akkermansia sp.]MEE1266166.1 tRNA (N6-isopentenyl adenosine(37)-C2)-methylthiotransferase MiaB [Akkermansia sp.]